MEHIKRLWSAVGTVRAIIGIGATFIVGAYGVFKLMNTAPLWLKGLFFIGVGLVTSAVLWYVWPILLHWRGELMSKATGVKSDTAKPQRVAIKGTNVEDVKLKNIRVIGGDRAVELERAKGIAIDDLTHETGEPKKTQPGIEFHDNQDTLLGIPSQLATVERVWLLWHTGSRAAIADIPETGKVQKVILPKPGTSATKLLAAAYPNRTPQQLDEEICAITKRFQLASVDVKWYEGIIASTLTFGDPTSDRAWVLVQPFMHAIDVDSRPSFRITKAERPDLYERYLASYQFILGKATKAPNSKDVQEGHSD